MKTTNGMLACAPFESTSIQIDRQKGYAVIKQKVALIGTVVLFANEAQIAPGALVYLKGDAVAQPWAKEVYQLTESDEVVSFILVPATHILGYSVAISRNKGSGDVDP